MNVITDISRLTEMIPGLRAGRNEEASRTGQAGDNTGIAPEGKPYTPQMDEYVPGEPPEPSGLYRLGRDGDGARRIIFDNPERDNKAAPEAEGKPAKEPEKAGDKSKKAESCTGNTDKVDREIERLKKKQASLEQKLARCKDDPEEQARLEKELAKVENELRVKDTDSYRRQHSSFILR